MQHDNAKPVNPFAPPTGDGAVAFPPRKPRPRWRLYSWLSIGFGIAGIVVSMQAKQVVDQSLLLWERLGAGEFSSDTGPGGGGESLPPPQAGLMATVAEGIVSTAVSSDSRLEWVQWLWFAMWTMMPPLLLFIGIGQVRMRRWLSRLCIGWSVIALAELAATALIFILVMHNFATPMFKVILLGVVPLCVVAAPYPLLLMRAAWRGRRDEAENASTS